MFTCFIHSEAEGYITARDNWRVLSYITQAICWRVIQSLYTVMSERQRVETLVTLFLCRGFFFSWVHTQNNRNTHRVDLHKDTEACSKYQLWLSLYYLLCWMNFSDPSVTKCPALVIVNAKMFFEIGIHFKSQNHTTFWRGTAVNQWIHIKTEKGVCCWCVSPEWKAL